VKVKKRSFKAGEIFHSELQSDGVRIRLVVLIDLEGWLAGIGYLDTNEWITKGVYPEVEDAKRVAEGYARTVLGIKSKIEWLPGPMTLSGDSE
jgi:hypothetical protein